MLEIDRLDFDQGKVALSIFGRTDLPRDRIPGPQIEFSNLGRRDVNVVRPGQVVLIGSAQEPESFREAF
jgi:hypothetical protein